MGLSVYGSAYRSVHFSVYRSGTAVSRIAVFAGYITQFKQFLAGAVEALPVFPTHFLHGFTVGSMEFPGVYIDNELPFSNL